MVITSKNKHEQINDIFHSMKLYECILICLETMYK